MITLLSSFSDYYLLIARVIIGVIFLAHGWPKLRNLPATWQNFSMMGFRPGFFWGTIVAHVEFFGSLALILGIGTQIAAALLAIDILVAALWKMSRGQGLVGGYELDIAILAAVLMILGIGGGAFVLGSFLPIGMY